MSKQTLSPVPPITGKLPWLDGIRGLMAVCVIIAHFTIVFYPQTQLEYYAQTMGGPLSLFASTPLSIFVSGNSAVQYFFILTGFLVARSSFGQPLTPEQIVKRSVGRYVRLLPIVVITTVFTYLCMVLGLQHHLDITQLLPNPNWLPVYCNFQPSLGSLLVNSFVYPYIRSSAYVGPFWTIRYEFFGYILSMVVCHLLRETQWRRVGYLIIAVLCFSQLSPHYVPFLLGVFVADLCYNDRPDTLDGIVSKLNGKKGTILAAGAVGAYLACCPLYFTGIYSFFGRLPKIAPDQIRAAGVTMLVYTALHLPRVQKFFSGKFFLFLGELSFPVYALHWPIMLCLECWLFGILLEPLGYDGAAVTAFLVTLPVIYAAAWGLQKGLDRWGKWK